MPVYEAAGSTVIHFGRGDILISKAFNPDRERTDEICLIADDRENRPNTKMSQERWDAEFKGKNSEETKVPVRLAFENVSGLDALICELMELRVEMSEPREPTPA
jgi:hypothetical protein